MKLKEKLKSRMVSAAGWEGKLKPVYVGGMFFADDPDDMSGWGSCFFRSKDKWALWVDGHGFVCADEHMIWPIGAHPFTMSKDVAKAFCKKGIANWGQIFFVENRDYYVKLITKAVKKMGLIYLDDPVEIRHNIWKGHCEVIDHIDYVEGINLCAFRNHANRIDSLNCYDTKSVVAVGRELVKTLNNKNIKL